MTEERVDDDGGAPGNHRNGSAGGSLPRRSAQRHLEPQLRETRGAGHGTPFTAFTPVATPVTEPEEDEPAGASGAAEFVEGARRGRDTAGD